METLVPIIMQVIAGIAGGTGAGAAVKNAAMGMLPKLLSGAIGGVGGAQILSAILGSSVGDTSSAFDIGSLINNIGGGAAGGGILTAIVGMVMSNMKK